MYCHWQFYRRSRVEGNVVKMVCLAMLMLGRKQCFGLSLIEASSLGRFLLRVLVLVHGQYPRVGQQHPREAEQQQISQTRTESPHLQQCIRIGYTKVRGKCQLVVALGLSQVIYRYPMLQKAS
jgi:hypothetical protein